MDDDHRVDFVGFKPAISTAYPAAIERGTFVFVEVKSCMADFTSGHAHTTRNRLPKSTAHRVTSLCSKTLSWRSISLRNCRSSSFQKTTVSMRPISLSTIAPSAGEIYGRINR